MLNVSSLIVLRKGLIEGIITKHEFIQRRRAEDVPQKNSKKVTKPKQLKEQDEGKQPLIELEHKEPEAKPEAPAE